MNDAFVNEKNLQQFEEQDFINLETFYESGKGVKTPVWFVQEENTFYVRTVDDSWKVKRLRKNPQARIVPCDGRGEPRGQWIPATAVINEDETLARDVNDQFNRKYGLQKRFFDLMGRVRRDRLTTLTITAGESE